MHAYYNSIIFHGAFFFIMVVVVVVGSFILPWPTRNDIATTKFKIENKRCEEENENTCVRHRYIDARALPPALFSFFPIEIVQLKREE